MNPRVTLFLLAAALFLTGCSTTYIPVSWGMGERVQRISRDDATLAILFKRYDPARKTLRVMADSFDEAMMPSEVKHHQGAYRPDLQLIYRNLYLEYSDLELRNLMVHELAHHVWFTRLSREAQQEWHDHLLRHPSPWQDVVRRSYPNPASFDAEDFAFTVEFARETDIAMLVYLKVISPAEGHELSSRNAIGGVGEDMARNGDRLHDAPLPLRRVGMRK